MKKLNDFEIRSDSGEVCISGDLDYETRNSYEFPIIATDRGKMINVITDGICFKTNKILVFLSTRLQVAWAQRRWSKYNWPTWTIIGRFFIPVNTTCRWANLPTRICPLPLPTSNFRLLWLSQAILTLADSERWRIGSLLETMRKSSESTESPEKSSSLGRICYRVEINRIIGWTSPRAMAAVCELHKTPRYSLASSTHLNVRRFLIRLATTSPSKRMPRRTQSLAPSQQCQAIPVSFVDVLFIKQKAFGIITRRSICKYSFNSARKLKQQFMRFAISSRSCNNNCWYKDQ